MDTELRARCRGPNFEKSKALYRIAEADFVRRIIFTTSNSQDHILQLMRSLREFIEGNDKRRLETSINSLKEEFSDAAVTTQIQLAVFLFRDAVNNVLRSHNIKPHWMFALDSLMGSAIQAAIHILSPGTDEIRFYFLMHIKGSSRLG